MYPPDTVAVVGAGVKGSQYSVRVGVRFATTSLAWGLTRSIVLLLVRGVRNKPTDHALQSDSFGATAVVVRTCQW